MIAGGAGGGGGGAMAEECKVVLMNSESIEPSSFNIMNAALIDSH